MRSPGTWINVPGGAAALLWLWLVQSPQAAELAPLEDQLVPWYYTEVVIFERPAVLDHLAGEELTRPPAPLRRDLRVFRTPDTPPSADYHLDPAMPAFLAFPYLDQSLLPNFETDATSEAGDLAAEQAAEPAGVAPPVIRPRLEPDPLLEFLDALAGFQDELGEQSYRWLPAEQFTLAPEARALERRAGFKVLLHGRWLQPVPDRERPEPVLIQAADAGDGQALEGTVDVTLGRYLHFRANLYYTEPLLGRAPVEFPSRPGESGAGASSAVTLDSLTPAGYMQLRESRRLRSDELHYLDHPKLGVLVRIEAVQPPAPLDAAYQALRSSVEERKQ